MVTDPGQARAVDPQGPVLFLSDAHLGVRNASPQRTDWLLDLLRTAAGRVRAAYLLGDLFDFWFEYSHAVPKGYFRFLEGVARLREAGIPVTYLTGNHDYWVGSYLARELGCEVFHEPITRRLHDRRIFMAHGDGLGPGDLGYRILKRVLRNRVSIALYRCIHPDLGIPLAHRVAAASRRHTQRREVILPRLYRDIALPRFREGYDAVLMGHVHEPAHVRADQAGQPREFIILGDWLENFTYLELEGGRFTLMRWNPGRSPLPVPVEEPPAGATRS